MNPYLTRIKRIDLDTDGTVIVPVELLQQCLQQQQREEQTRERIARILVRVRQKMVAIRQYRKQIVQQAQQTAEESLHAWEQEAKEQAVKETLYWHVEESQIVGQVVQGIQQEIYQQIWKVVSEWAMEEQPDRYLIRRLTRLVSENSKLGALTLSVAPENYQQMQQQFAGQLTVISEARLAKYQAELTSSTLTIKVNLKEHLDLLLAAFISPVQLEHSARQPTLAQQIAQERQEAAEEYSDGELTDDSD